MVVQRGLNEYGDGVGWFRGSMIGKGSFGSVYLATSKNRRSKWCYFPSVMAVKSAEVSVSGSIQKEREVLSNIRGCSDVIRCFGEETTMGENGVMVYNLLLEYGSGGTLADRIRISGGGDGLSEIEAKVFAKCLLRGLHHIHGIGYVHCDLKPDNILLVPHRGLVKFRAKIGDFGLAKRANNNQSKKRRSMEPYWRGTPMYLSPEAVSDNVQESPSDIWALGCIVLQMLTGKPPWDDLKELNSEELIRMIREGRQTPKIPNGVSKEAKDFLKGCFVRKPVYRLTAEMLLNHPFLEGLDGYDVVEEEEAEEEVEDLNVVESILLVSENESEVSCGFSDDDLLCYSSEDDYEEDEKEDIKDVAGLASIDTGLSRTKKKLRAISSSEETRCFPVSFTIPAGI